MISVLIPIYNQDITALVKMLTACVDNVDVPVEILCYDDGSQEAYKVLNQEIDKLNHVRYKALSKNIGRSKIRNLLAEEALYPYLIYLDGDSVVQSTDFIQKYIDNRADCVSGGRIYRTEMPEAPFVLHWTYGSLRESRTIVERIQNPIRYFHSNNFLIKKELLLKHPFPEYVSGYGYEDLVMAQELVSNGYTITHIDNPTIHGILDSSTDYIKKSIRASKNLRSYYEEKKISRTPLIRTYERLNRIGLSTLYCGFFRCIEPYVIKNLESTQPRILFLNLLKLYHFTLGR